MTVLYGPNDPNDPKNHPYTGDPNAPFPGYQGGGVSAALNSYGQQNKNKQPGGIFGGGSSGSMGAGSALGGGITGGMNGGMGAPSMGGGMQMPKPSIGQQGIPPMTQSPMQMPNPQMQPQMGGMMGGNSFGSPSPQVIAAIMAALGLGGNKQFGGF